MAALASLSLTSGEAMAHKLNFAFANGNYQVEIDENSNNAKLIAALPLTLTFEDYGSHERIAYLEGKLDIPVSVSCNPVRGDFTYYVPWGNIAVFTKDFRTSQSLYRFGKLSEELLDAIANSGQETVTISVIE